MPDQKKALDEHWLSPLPSHFVFIRTPQGVLLSSFDRQGSQGSQEKERLIQVTVGLMTAEPVGPPYPMGPELSSTMKAI